MKVILDACAVIALVKNEAGEEVVEEFSLNSRYDLINRK